MGNTNQNEVSVLTLRKRLDHEAVKQAGAIANTFDLRKCLHLENFDPENELVVELPYVLGKRGQTASIPLDDLTEAIRDWLREVLPSKIARELLERHLSKENPEVDVSTLL